MTEESLQQFRQSRTCAIVPTYNNAGTVCDVVRRMQPYIADIIVVNDGSTDDTAQLLQSLGSTIEVVDYGRNRGKGYALRRGFERARQLGFDHAVTLDADGQHYPEELPIFARAIEQHPEALIVGNRKLQQQNMPGKNTFANYFSNFWFMLQTWQYLPDTQTGYRVYPLHNLHGLRWLTNRYEAELELLVAAAWHGVKLVSTPIRVYYPPREERVSHFRPFWDFARISLLNTVLCVLCVCYGWWMMLWYKFLTTRLGRKLLTFGVLTFSLLYALVYPLPAVWWRQLTHRDSELDKWRYHILLCRFFRSLLHHIPQVRVRIDNPYKETFDRPAIVICNHQSHLDLLSVLSLSPRMVALTNEWVWNFPVYKPVLRYLEYYPATEGLEQSVNNLADVVAHGYSIVIFPEGTRSADCKILKFHRGAFYLSEQLHCDIVPVYLEGPGKVLPKRDLTLQPGQITITIGQRVSADDTSAGNNYREKTRYWHRHYAAQLS
ncbi:MAG: glycosyltransferase [Bacteroidales bacterium]|nr:glycosyltransferase [Bacteroidales bacterium]